MKNTRIWATLLLLIMLGGLLSGTTLMNYHIEKELCFQRLNGYVASIGKIVSQDMKENQNYLASMGRVLSCQDLTDHEKLGEFLAAMEGTGMVTRLELLLPGDLLVADECLTEISGQRSFSEEAEAGAHVFWQKGETDGEIILRQCVPVQRNGKTAAVLCGVIDLEKIPHLLVSKEYGEEMQLYIFDRTSGQFLLDTWHGTLTTRESLGGRKPAKGFSKEQFDEDLDAGRAGFTVFRSNTTGEDFYTSYAPVDTEDWMVMVTVPDRVVFAYAKRMLICVYLLMAGVLCSFFIFFFWTLRDIRREQKDGKQKLKDIHYILDVEKNLFQAPNDAVYFHNALQKIAEYLSAKRVFFWAVSDNMPQQIRWSDESGGREQDISFQTEFPHIFQQLQEQGEIIRYEFAEGETADSEEAASELQEIFRILGAKNLMMIPVRKRNGIMAGILGAVDMEKRRENTEPLRQVSVSFSIALEQYDLYRRIERVSRTDTMTGLKNRNGFHEALLALETRSYGSFGCVYADANGLHEINNRLGHAAGDEMLIQIAKALNIFFPDDDVYRIGGDEFVVLCLDRAEKNIAACAKNARQQIHEAGYEISLGVAWRDRNIDPSDVVKDAEQAMRTDKQQYYESPGRERYLRCIDEKTKQMFLRQQDTENFLSAVAPQFRGVYFVDLSKDSSRYLFIPSYFEELLNEAGGRFSKGILLYARELVKPDYYEAFVHICDYDALQEQLDGGTLPELIYQKKDGSWFQLRVIPVHTDEKKETLWIFVDIFVDIMDKP